GVGVDAVGADELGRLGTVAAPEGRPADVDADGAVLGGSRGDPGEVGEALDEAVALVGEVVGGEPGVGGVADRRVEVGDPGRGGVHLRDEHLDALGDGGVEVGELGGAAVQLVRHGGGPLEQGDAGREAARLVGDVVEGSPQL